MHAREGGKGGTRRRCRTAPPLASGPPAGEDRRLVLAQGHVEAGITARRGECAGGVPGKRALQQVAASGSKRHQGRRRGLQQGVRTQLEEVSREVCTRHADAQGAPNV